LVIGFNPSLPSPLAGEGRGEGENAPIPPLAKEGWGDFEELTLLTFINTNNYEPRKNRDLDKD
jgi:hypothetical protein